MLNEIAWAGTTEDWRYEWIELFNPTGQDIDISNWQVENGASSNKTLTISAGAIAANGYFLVCRKEMSGCGLVETKLSLHNEYNTNGQLILRNSAGNLIDSTPLSQDKAWPGGDNTTKQTMELCSGSWQTSEQPNGTPDEPNQCLDIGYPNIEEPPPALLSPPEPPTQTESPPQQTPEIPEEPIVPELTEYESIPGSKPEPQPLVHSIIYPSGIYINEILPSPRGSDIEDEWIELYNSNDFEVDLGDWQIKDKEGQVRTYAFPVGTKMCPNCFLTLVRPESKITLQNSGDVLELLNPNKEIIYSITYAKAPTGQSYARESENWSWTTTLTPGQANIITLKDKPSPPEKAPVNTITDIKDKAAEEKDALADIGQTLPQKSNKLLVFILAAVIAIGSSIIILIIKLKAENSSKIKEGGCF